VLVEEMQLATEPVVEAEVTHKVHGAVELGSKAS
jgi:hypothetical protein